MRIGPKGWDREYEEEKKLTIQKNEKICPTCFLVKPCECDDK